MRAGLHYIAVNLLASTLFLVGVAMLYGVTGTLNMADIAQKLPQVPAADRGLLHAGAAILAWPSSPRRRCGRSISGSRRPMRRRARRSRRCSRVMTKVGVYAVLRCSMLFFGGDGAIDPLGSGLLVAGGCVTLAVGAFAMLAAQRLARMAGACVAVSSGTLIAALGFGLPSLTAGALFYLTSSTLALAALYLLVELGERVHDVDTDQPEPEVHHAALPFALEAIELPQGVNLDDEERALVGRVLPTTVVFLGLAYLACALVIAGLPPLSGFLAKFAMLSAALDPDGVPNALRSPPSTSAWLFVALVIAAGLLATIALARTGMRSSGRARATPSRGCGSWNASRWRFCYSHAPHSRSAPSRRCAMPRGKPHRRSSNPRPISRRDVRGRSARTCGRTANGPGIATR